MTDLTFDRRATLESEVLSIVSSYGGERIIAGPTIERLVRDLADLWDRRADIALIPEGSVLVTEAELAEALHDTAGTHSRPRMTRQICPGPHMHSAEAAVIIARLRGEK